MLIAIVNNHEKAGNKVNSLQTGKWIKESVSHPYKGKLFSIIIIWAIGAYNIDCEFESRECIYDSVYMTFSKRQN